MHVHPRNFVKSRTLALLLMMACALCGCAGSTTAVVDSLRYAVRSRSSTPAVVINPEYRYLRASIDGRTVILVLGYVDKHPQGPVEVWYSAEREILRLQNGRIVGAVGLTTEWRKVALSTSPAWLTLSDVSASVLITRVRDVMPGYRFGIEESLTVRPIPVPARTQLIDIDPSTLNWFEEKVSTGPKGIPLSAEDAFPPARFAVRIQPGAETVVYGEQCLAPKVCFTWQRWPATPPQPK